jgi:hypothetical protein
MGIAGAVAIRRKGRAGYSSRFLSPDFVLIGADFVPIDADRRLPADRGQTWRPILQSRVAAVVPETGGLLPGEPRQ